MKCAPMAIIAVLVLSPTGAAQAAGVNPAGIGTTGIDVEIVLAADVSRSIDDGEFELQRRGYAAALTDPRVLKAIHRTKDGAIGVCFIEWSGENEQRVVLGWTEIRDAEDGGDAAAVIRKAPRSFTGRTSISAAIDFARAYFGKAKWGSTLHRIIDVSGDGNSNAGRPLAEARDDAVAAGITINGLAIINEQASFAYSAHTHPPGGLPNYYRQNVIGGPNAFLLVVKDFNSFADAMANKLAKEIDIANAAGGTAVAALR
ncbi:MAG TPA: DUF1194 domain-containing protein [Stellaceae bacterium]|nr:DUF1194 domain-containing protein [Stellaceae bacterium]